MDRNPFANSWVSERLMTSEEGSRNFLALAEDLLEGEKPFLKPGEIYRVNSAEKHDTC